MQDTTSAMTEVALGLSMAFFTLLIVALLSMGFPKEAQSNATTLPDDLQKKAILDLKIEGKNTGNTKSDRLFAFYFDDKFYDESLSLRSIASFSKDKNLIVAVNPNLSFADVLSLRQQINHPKLSITASNKTWHNSFYLENQQSTNGSFFNKTQLTAQQKVIISEDAKLTLGAGKGTNKLSLCQLQLSVTSDTSPSLMMQLRTSPAQLVDSEYVKTAWPSMDIDLLSRWVLLGDEISLSINNDGIELGHDKDQANIVAYLIYQNGFYIRSKQGSDKMPIEKNAVISLNGFEFTLQSCSN